VRVYDVGRCSQVVRWPLLVHLLGMGIMQSLTDIRYASPLTPTLVRVSPIIRATPRLPSLLPLGPLEQDDRVALHLGFSADSVAGCSNPEITVDAVVSLEPSHPLLSDEQTWADDQLLSMVGCQIDPIDPYRYNCTLLRNDGSGSVVLFPQDFWRNADDPYETDPAMLNEIRCWIDNWHYECTEPVPDPEWPYYPPDFLGLDTRRYTRHARELSDGWVWNVDLVSYSVDFADPCIADWFTGSFISRIERGVSTLNARLSELIGQSFGDSFIDDFGLSADDLPVCGTLPDGSPNDADCQRTHFYGGRRHRCDPHRFNSAGQTVCDIARLDVRRMHGRPEGLELVFVENDDDPQLALLNGHPGLAPPGSALATLQGTPDDPLCYARRVWAELVPGDDPFPTMLTSTDALSVLIPSVPICDTTDASCTGICPQYGTTCAVARAFGLDAAHPLPPSPTPVRCVYGTCM
jgi:hypothetical protein